MNKLQYIVKLLLILFSPVIFVAIARVIHIIYMWVLAGVVSSREAWYFALLLTIVSFTATGIYALLRWLNE